MDGRMIVYFIEGAFAVGVLGLMWKVNVESTKKIDAVFRRFDEHKDKVREDFVNKDVCKIITKRVADDLDEIKLDVKTLLRKNGFKTRRKR